MGGNVHPYNMFYHIQGGSNMTGTKCGLFTHKSVPVIFEPPCIIHEHVLVASATIIKVSYKNTNHTQIIAQNVYLKPLNIVVNILSTPCSHKKSNYVIVKNKKIGCAYVAS